MPSGLSKSLPMGTNQSEEFFSHVLGKNLVLQVTEN